MTTERTELVERRELVKRDLEELGTQVEEGEVTAATAERLRSAYLAELDSLDHAIRDLPAPEAASARERRPEARSKGNGEDGPSAGGRSPKAIIVGSLVIVAILSVVIAFAARDSSPREQEGAEVGTGELTIDPDSVSNEQLEEVVAANPGIIGMRMALADRYFDAEEYGSALDHYLHIADNATDPTDESKALARIGWMAYITGLPQEADRYVAASLRVDPANAEGVLYRGFVTLYGLGDAAAAIPELESALQLSNLSANVVSQIETALDEAREATTP